MTRVDVVASSLLVRRHLIYQRHAWAAVVTALVEPAVYFAAALVGIGYVVEGGFSQDYVRYAGPALLAVTVMNGAVSECTNNVFFRWREGRLYDSVLCTPLTGSDIAVADLAFGALRGWVSGIAFLALLTPFLKLDVARIVVISVTSVVIAVMFAALGLLIVTFVQTWRRLQLVQLGFFVMFLCANTFVDLGTGGRALEILAQAMPLTHANDLVRAAVEGDSAALSREIAVVLGVAVVLVVLAVRRVGRALSG